MSSEEKCKGTTKDAFGDEESPAFVTDEAERMQPSHQTHQDATIADEKKAFLASKGPSVSANSDNEEEKCEIKADVLVPAIGPSFELVAPNEAVVTEEEAMQSAASPMPPRSAQPGAYRVAGIDGERNLM